MPDLTDHVQTLADAILNEQCSLDDALYDLEGWLDDHAAGLSPDNRRAFSASLDQASQGSNQSLVDSILRLHTTRLLYRHDKAAAALESTEDGNSNAYTKTRTAFSDALQHSEDTINETRIDIAIANAHNLLGDVDANRRWLDTALERLPPLAANDLVALAQSIPDMPLPKLNWWKRIGIKLAGFSLARLSEKNRSSLTTIARMQTDQIVIMAHLLGTSYEAIRERQRANRAFRIVAHLIARHNGMQLRDSTHLLDIAESIQRAEPEAADILMQQARESGLI